MGSAEDEDAILAALRHPTRRRVLIEMTSTPNPISPVELSRAANERLSNVSYHVRVLLGLQMIRLVETRPVRGSTQHYYEPGPALDIPWVRSVLHLPAKDDDGAVRE